MIIIHLVIAIVIIAFMVRFAPLSIYNFLGGERNKKMTLLGSIFSLYTPVLICFLAIPGAFVHYVVDMFISLISYLFKFKYEYFNDTKTGINVLKCYLEIATLIVLVTSSLYYSQNKVKIK